MFVLSQTYVFFPKNKCICKWRNIFFTLTLILLQCIYIYIYICLFILFLFFTLTLFTWGQCKYLPNKLTWPCVNVLGRVSVCINTKIICKVTLSLGLLSPPNPSFRGLGVKGGPKTGWLYKFIKFPYLTPHPWMLFFFVFFFNLTVFMIKLRVLVLFSLLYR